MGLLGGFLEAQSRRAFAIPRPMPKPTHPPCTRSSWDALLPDELIVLIALMADEALSLVHLERVSKRIRSVLRERETLLWSRLIRKDFRLWTCAEPTATKDRWRDIFLGKVPTHVQIIHVELSEGRFGSLCSEVVTHWPPVESLRPSNILRTSKGRFVPAGRARRLPALVGDGLFHVPSFRAFKPNDTVEVQWRRHDASPFSWWFAVVAEVISDDEMELFFPQYSTNQPVTVLKDRVILRRRGHSPMHGGTAGGVRAPDEDELRQWMACMCTGDVDHEYHMRGTSMGTGRVPLVHFGEVDLVQSIPMPFSSFEQVRAKFIDNFPLAAPSAPLVHVARHRPVARARCLMKDQSEWVHQLRDLQLMEMRRSI